MTNGDIRVAVGTDIVEVERIGAAIKRFRNAFLAKVFTADELAHCAKSAICHPSLAARFAAKEAFSKALATGIGIGSPLKWQDVSVQSQASGAPEIILSPSAGDLMERRGFSRVSVSLAHSKMLAQAVVILTS
ncbi:MAG: holo-ACP synthase [Puniceicoccales bacterium]|jgi:holo-[acyl-carrier protein] synthase|nr:holo-ACP synthase [Puniceicoccales bacterium]